MATNSVEGGYLPIATYVAGAMWGDEGKGKIASAESASKDARLVIRATGGANAGHTVIYNGKKIGLHLIPGGITSPDAICLIGQGVAFDPILFLKELEELEEYGIPDVRGRIKISGRAPVVLPYHKDMDELYERAKDKPVGTTKRGIGPTYSDYDNRFGLRVYDLLLPEEKLAGKISVAARILNVLFEAFNMKDSLIKPVELARELSSKYASILSSMVVNGDTVTRWARKNGYKVIVEGAQAYRLDKNYGDYPNVTSSNCVTAGAMIGAHLNHKDMDEVIMVSKAYASRVGNGPFPTELEAHIANDKVLPYMEPFAGDVIRELGHEYGVSTGRPRRVGWADAVILKCAGEALGADVQCINHLDTIGKIGEALGEVKVCVAYEYLGKKIDYYPDDMELTGEVPTPIYKTLKGGWKISSNLRSYDELPEKAKKFIEIIEKFSEVPVKYIGVGPKDDDIIVKT